MIIGLDIGTHSIKVAERKNAGNNNLVEQRTILLNNLDGKEISFGNDAIKEYFNRKGDCSQLSLLDGIDVVKDHLRGAVVALEIDNKPDMIALTVPNKKSIEEKKDLLKSVQEVFETSKIFVLDDAICAAAVYKENNPNEDFLLICDLGKSALKLSFCDLRNDMLLINHSTSVSQFAWGNFENRLLQEFNTYRSLANNEYMRRDRDRFRYDCLESLFALDQEDKYRIIYLLENDPENLMNHGIHEQKFISFWKPEVSLNTNEMHQLYQESFNNILSTLKDHIGNRLSETIPEEYCIPMMFIGSAVSPKKFADFLVSIVNKQLKGFFVKVYLPDNPKFAVAEGALKIISNEITIHKPLKITVKRDKLVNGLGIEEEKTIIKQNNCPKFGVDDTLQKFKFHSDSLNLEMKVGEEDLKVVTVDSPGKYDLIQTMDCFGMPIIEFRKSE